MNAIHRSAALLAFAAFAAGAFAQITQEWLRVRHRFFPSAVLQEASGAYLVVGTEYDAPPPLPTAYTDAGILRYSATGQLLWAWSSNIAISEHVRAAALDPQGNIVIILQVGAGHLYQSVETWRVMKVSPTGTILWSTDYSGRYLNTAEPFRLTLDDAGNIYVAGADYQLGNERDFAILKYSPSGQQLWAYHLGGPLWDLPNSIALRDGAVYVSGHTAFNGPEATLVKIDAQTGQEQWVRTWSDTGPLVTASATAFDSAGNVYVTGVSENYQTTSQDILISRVTPGGDIQWTIRHNYAATNWYDRGSCILVAPDGSVYVSGGTFQNYGEEYYDMALVKYAADGQFAWERKWGTPRDFTGNETEEESAAIFIDDAGFIYSIASDWTQPGFDTIVLKYDADGTFVGSLTTDTPGGSFEFLGTHHFDPARRKVVLSSPGVGFGGGTQTVAVTSMIDLGPVCTGPCPCDPIDFNGDGLFPDTQDTADFLTVFGGGACPTGACSDIDFNNDGLFPDTLDIDSLLSVFSGGPCL